MQHNLLFINNLDMLYYNFRNSSNELIFFHQCIYFNNPDDINNILCTKLRNERFELLKIQNLLVRFLLSKIYI
jgi:hypothetical protein